MSVRARELAQFQAAGWTVVADSPWSRLPDRPRGLAVLVGRVVWPAGRSSAGRWSV